MNSYGRRAWRNSALLTTLAPWSFQKPHSGTISLRTSSWLEELGRNLEEAARQLGRNYIGVELNAEHCATSRQRLQSNGYMAELDLWSEANVIGPLQLAAPDFQWVSKEWEQTVEEVKSAIRAKVLESYRNGGQATSPRPTRR